MARNRPGLGQARRNWVESNDPYVVKVEKLLRNQLRKVLRRRPCCGHPGEPGC